MHSWAAWQRFNQYKKILNKARFRQIQTGPLKGESLTDCHMRKDVNIVFHERLMNPGCGTSPSGMRRSTSSGPAPSAKHRGKVQDLQCLFWPSHGSDPESSSLRADINTRSQSPAEESIDPKITCKLGKNQGLRDWGQLLIYSTGLKNWKRLGPSVIIHSTVQQTRYKRKKGIKSQST